MCSMPKLRSCGVLCPWSCARCCAVIMERALMSHVLTAYREQDGLVSDQKDVLRCAVLSTPRGLSVFLP